VVIDGARHLGIVFLYLYREFVLASLMVYIPTLCVLGVLKLRRRIRSNRKEDDDDVVVMQLPGRKGVRIDGCDGDSVIRWKPLAKVSFLTCVNLIDR
jgi:hypothetical protein